MKVAVFIETGGIGGAELMVLELLTLLRAAGVGAFLLGIRPGSMTAKAEERGIPTVFVDSGSSLAFPFRIRRVLQDHGVHLVHSNSLDTNFHSALATCFTGIKHLATEHGDVHHPDKRGKLAFKLKVMAALGTEFNSVSHFSRDKLETFGLRPAKISAIPNPVSLVREDYLSFRDEIREATGAKENTFVWLHVANLRRVKDQHTLIRGFASSARSGAKNQQLWIVGDGKLRPELETLARSEGVAEKVIFHGFSNEVPRFLAAGDGFILSSLSEAMPMSLIEAASMKLILVGSRVGGIPEVISDRTGYLFEKGNSLELGEILSSVSGDPVGSGAQDRASNSFNLVQEKFSGRVVVEQYIERYQNILS